LKRSFLIVSLLALASACSQQPNDETVQPQVAEETASADVAASTSDAASSENLGRTPNIGIDVAPGVAFDYRFDFSLNEARIAATQESHAALCGKLGITHCRVTGLKFNKSRGGEIDAMMAFKLDPAYALRFGRDAAEIVTDADGRLEASEVGGSDVGSGIVANDKSRDALSSELTKIEAQARIPGLSNKIRAELNRQAADLRAQLRSLGDERDAKVESLATTPVLFNYEVSDAVLGFDRSSPVQQGLSASKASLTTLFAFLAMLIGGAGPWIALVFAIWWLAKRLRMKQAVSAE
jgi:hypothetical protein